MPTYQFKCKTHGDYDVIMPSSGNLRENKCNECGKLAKRVYTVPNHAWTGFSHPSYETAQTDRRFDRIKKFYGLEKAESLEVNNKRRSSSKNVDMFQ